METVTSGPGKTVMLLEPDPEDRRRALRALARLGWGVYAPSPEQDWLNQAASLHPHFLLLVGGAKGCIESRHLGAIKRRVELAGTKIIMLSEQNTREERAAAYAAGIDQFAAKLYTAQDLNDTLSSVDRFIVTFWGIRGTLPVPGNISLRYGGNTSCVTLAIGCDRQLVLDAGTGLKAFSDHLESTADGRFDGHLLISHPHWDHLNSLPFFAPMYLQGNHIHLHGPPQGSRSLRDLISAQMDGVFFPITVDDFEAEVLYDDLFEGRYCFDGIAVTAKRLRHPGHCLAYRVSHGGHSMAYVTDNELGQRGSIQLRDEGLSELTEFLRDVDVLVHDTTYFDDEYPKKVNWGHSSVGQVARLAHAADVKHVYLFHHAPDHDDTAIDRKLAIAQGILDALGSKTRCHIAIERKEIDLQRL